MENTVEKVNFLKENNIKSHKTLVRVNSENYNNSGGYYGSSNGWIGRVILDGYVSSSMHEKLKVSFCDGDSWEYYPHELHIVTIDELTTMKDKVKSLKLLLGSNIINFKSNYFLGSVVFDTLLDWYIEDGILIIKAKTPVYDEEFTISIDNNK